MRKPFIFVLAVFMLCFIFAGCADKDDKQSEAASSPTEETQTEKPEETPEPSTTSIDEPEPQPSPEKTSEAETGSAEQTQDELEELSEALSGLTDGDFSDIDFSD